MPTPTHSALVALLGQVLYLPPAKAEALAARGGHRLRWRQGGFLVPTGQVKQRLCLVERGFGWARYHAAAPLRSA